MGMNQTVPLLSSWSSCIGKTEINKHINPVMRDYVMTVLDPLEGMAKIVQDGHIVQVAFKR